MATVIKGNALLTIPDDRVSDYVARGYDIASVEGTVIKKAVPTDLSELQRLYTDQVSKIVNLEKIIEQRDKQIESLESELDSLQTDYESLSNAYKQLENGKVEAETTKTTKKRTTKKADTE